MNFDLPQLKLVLSRCIFALLLAAPISYGNAQSDYYDSNKDYMQSGFYGRYLNSQPHSKPTSDIEDVSNYDVTAKESALIDEAKYANREANKGRFRLSDLQVSALKKLYAREAEKYHRCKADSGADCYTDEIFYLQRLLELGIAWGGYKFQIGLGRPFVRKNNLVRFYRGTLEFSENSSRVVDETCVKGRVHLPQTDWLASEGKVCRLLVRAADRYRANHFVASSDSERLGIPYRQVMSYFAESVNSNPCLILGDANCTFALNYARDRDGAALKRLAEKNASYSYFWKYFESLAHLQLGNIETALRGMNDLVSSFQHNAPYTSYAPLEWERYLGSAASTLIFHYYKIGDYNAVVECCGTYSQNTERLERDDHSIIYAQLLRASAMRLMDSPRLGSALFALREIESTLDRLDFSDDTTIRKDLNKQLSELLIRLDSLG